MPKIISREYVAPEVVDVKESMAMCIENSDRKGVAHAHI